MERPAHGVSGRASHVARVRGARLVPGGAADATAHAFMTTGDQVFVVPDGFAGAALKTTTEKVVAGRHRRGPADQRPGPRGDSDAHGLGGALDGPFSCWRIFVKDSTESLFVGCFNNVLCWPAASAAGVWLWAFPGTCTRPSPPSSRS